MSRPTLPLKFVSLDIVENGETSSLSPSSDIEGDSHCLQAVPGRSSELLIWLENTSNEPISWSLEVDGEFPYDWYDWLQTEPVIEPYSRLSQVIVFEPPADFFESNLESHGLSDQQLQLSYSGSVSVFAQIDSNVPSDYESDSAAGLLVGYKNIALTLHPENTYLDFLPEIYRSDFMERFMTIFEQAFDPTVQMTDNLWAYLDPLTAPKAMLPFLAKWVDWPMNADWTLRQQRKLIKHAVELYQWRGTRRGLRLMLHLYTGLSLDLTAKDSKPAIEIQESCEIGFVLGQVQLGNHPRLGGGKPYFFKVILRPESLASANEIDESLIRRIIEQEKPAFCSYDLEIVVPKA